MKEVFLTYANIPLRNNPKNLWEIFRKIDKHLSLPSPWILAETRGSSVAGAPPLTSIKPSLIMNEVINYLIYFAGHPSLAFAETALKSLSKSLPHLKNGTLEIAFEAVYGFRDAYCIDAGGQPSGWHSSSCLTIPDRKSLIEDDSIWGPEDHPNRIKCYECDQLYFRGALKLVVEGVIFDKIPGFKAFMNQNIFLAPPIDSRYGGWNWKPGPDPEFPYKHILSDFLRGIIAASLNHYLENNDLQLIKLCKNCNNFFVTKTKRVSWFCSDDCRTIWHNKDRIATGKAKEYKRMMRQQGKQQ